MSYQKHNFEAGAVLFASQLNDMDNQIEFLSNQGSSFSDDFKEALLNCFENVAWINENGQTYYDALYDSLYPDNMWFITNILTGCATSNNATSVFKNNSYVATITANEGYTLDGATVSILMGGNDVTNLYYSSGSINIPNVTGDLVITVTASSSVVSISAVFTQGQSIIYNTDSLDRLRQNLVVTAIFTDSSSSVVSDYELSGSLATENSTITVTYGNKSTTFSVNVIVIVSVNGTSMTLKQGTTVNEIVTTQTNTRAMSYATSGVNPFVDENGEDTIYYPFPIRAGTTTITAVNRVTNLTIAIGALKYEDGKWCRKGATQSVNADSFTISDWNDGTWYGYMSLIGAKQSGQPEPDISGWDITPVTFALS